MIIAKMRGSLLNSSLGHQMLIYATARTMGDDISLDVSTAHSELDKFNIRGRIVHNQKPTLDGWAIEGFDNIRQELIEEFSIKEELSRENGELLKAITSTNSVAIHVRHGDFITTHKDERDGICTTKYYGDAINIISEKVDSPRFFVFSDDIAWCEKNLLGDYVYVKNNPGYIDLELMKHCKHFIIANSSFSWWGAWLSENQNKIVVCPSRMRNTKGKGEELLLPQWTKVNGGGQ